MPIADDLDVWYRREAPSVRRFLLGLGADAWQAEDLTQETFLQALIGLRGYRGEGSPRAWLCGIALRRYLRARQREGRRREVRAAVQAAARFPTVRSQAAGDALAMLTDLSPENRALVWLRTVADWPYADVAQVLGITPNAARVRHFRLLSRLRHTIERERLEGRDKEGSTPGKGGGAGGRSAD